VTENLRVKGATWKNVTGKYGGHERAYGVISEVGE